MGRMKVAHARFVAGMLLRWGWGEVVTAQLSGQLSGSVEEEVVVVCGGCVRPERR